MENDLPVYTYEAKIFLEDGSTTIGTVEAYDKEDAKIEFGHSFLATDKEGKQHRIIKVDYRTVKLSKDQCLKINV